MLASQGSKMVLIGKDTRISGYMLESALEAGLAAAGLSAHLPALCRHLLLLI